MKCAKSNDRKTPMDTGQFPQGYGHDSGDLPRRSPSLKTLDDLDGRTRAAKLAHRLVTDLESDLGGDLSTAQRELVKRAALLGAIVEDYEVRWLEHKGADLSLYGTLVDRQRRILETLGLGRVARDVTDQVIARLEAVP